MQYRVGEREGIAEQEFVGPLNMNQRRCTGMKPRKGLKSQHIIRRSQRRGTLKGGVSMSNRAATLGLDKKLKVLGLW